MCAVNLLIICRSRFLRRIKSTAGKLFWLRRPAASAWSKKNGFFLLGDSLAAFILGTFLVVAALLVSQEALNLHRKARQLQETAMLARNALEETQPQAAAAEERVVNGHIYRIERQTLPFGGGYDKEVVNLYENGNLVYTLCRLAEPKENPAA